MLDLLPAGFLESKGTHARISLIPLSILIIRGIFETLIIYF